MMTSSIHLKTACQTPCSVAQLMWKMESGKLGWDHPAKNLMAKVAWEMMSTMAKVALARRELCPKIRMAKVALGSPVSKITMAKVALADGKVLALLDLLPRLRGHRSEAAVASADCSAAQRSVVMSVW